MWIVGVVRLGGAYSRHVTRCARVVLGVGMLDIMVIWVQDPSPDSEATRVLSLPLLLCLLGLKVMGSLKTRNRALPLQTCTLGYPGMSVHSAYKVVYEIYLKKIHQVLVEQEEKYEEFRVIRRKSCLAHVQDGKLRNKFDPTKYHIYTKLCEKLQALELTVAYMAEILKGA